MAAPTQKPQGRKPPAALIFLAYLRAASLGAIKWEDLTEYIPALITALLMPLSLIRSPPASGLISSPMLC